MADRRERLEGSGGTFKSTLKLAPAIGDWTTLKPVRVSSRKVKSGLYGFDRLSQEELKLTQTIHYNFAQAFLCSTKKNLSLGGDLFTISVEQSTYSDFLKRVYQPTAYCKIYIPNLLDEILVCIDMPIANTIINHALGGSDLSPITRKLTEIEEEVLTKAISAELGSFSASFEKIFETPKFKVVSTPEITLEGTINPASTFVFVSVEMSIGDNPPATIWFAYTATSLKTLLEKVQMRITQRPVNFGKLPPALLDDITIPLIVDLGETLVATQDLHSLEKGDVVALDASLEDLVPVLIGGFVRVMGQPGTKTGKLAARIFGSKISKTKAVGEMPRSGENISEEISPQKNLPLENEEEQEYSDEEEEGLLEDEFSDEEEEEGE